MRTEDTLTTWVNELLAEEDPALFLVDISVSSGKGMKKVVVHLDGDQGVPIDTCAKISRSLSHRLEEEDIIEGKYLLEVSSPGLDQPLLLKRQYTKNIGRHVKVLLADDKTVQGELLAVGEEQITVAAEGNRRPKKRTETKETNIPFDQIKKTNVLVIFN